MNSQSGARTAVVAIAVILVAFLGGLGLSQVGVANSGVSSPASASSPSVSAPASSSSASAALLAKEKAEAEAAQKKAKAEAEAKAKEKAEAEAKAKAEEEAKKKAEEEAKAQAEAEAAAAEAERIRAEEEQRAAEEEAARIAAEEEAARQAAAEEEAAQQASAAAASVNIATDFRASFDHGYKGAEYQKYIVLHDTEGTGDPYSVINYWDGNGAGVAAHFVVHTDGTVVQCVPLDRITHHAGFGDTGHNALYGVEDESRDDKVGTVPIGDWAADYGMNSYSVGIEMVHVSGSGYYPEEQLAAVDAVIAYIDSYFGFPSTIIDHKAWRSGNSDTSPEFAGYLANYQDHRTHY